MKIDVEKFMSGLHEYFSKEITPILARIKSLEGRQLEKGAAGAKGDSGADGKDGIQGAKGDSGVDGKDGIQGAKGDSGADGKDGANINEKDIEAVVQRQVAVWELEFERRAMIVLQKAIDKIPSPENGMAGKDGKDALGFDELSVVQLDAKRLKIVFEAGENKKEFIIKMPIVVDAGIYKGGKEYTKGDGVTYGGSFWIAQVDNPNQSPGKGAEWRLAVKRGKDAREVQL